MATKPKTVKPSNMIPSIFNNDGGAPNRLRADAPINKDQLPSNAKPKGLDPITSPDVPAGLRTVMPAFDHQPSRTKKAPRARRPSDDKPRKRSKAKSLDAGIPAEDRAKLKEADKLGPTLDAAAIKAQAEQATHDQAMRANTPATLRAIFNGIGDLLNQAQHLIQGVEINDELMSMKAEMLTRIVTTSKEVDTVLRADVAHFVALVESTRRADEIRAAIMGNDSAVRLAR